MTIPQLIPNEAAGNICIVNNIHGPAHTVCTACASGTDAIGYALDQIRAGRVDVALAGGTESAINGFTNLSFGVLQALSSKWADNPSKASRPFDKDRDGFVMGEGSTILILEEYEHAKARGAKIYAEVAETLNINKPRVERAIRHAITTILNKPYGLEHLETIFGCKTLRDNLTTGQFLNLCVETLKHFV